MKSTQSIGLALGGALAVGVTSAACNAQETLPKPDPVFHGKVAPSIDSKPAGEAHFNRFGPFRSGETLGIGTDTGSPVTSSYYSSIKFNGKIEQVKIDLIN